MQTNQIEVDAIINDLTSGEFRTLQATIAKIARIGPEDPLLAEQAIPALLALLEDVSCEIRMRCCWALGQIGYKSPQAVRSAIPALLGRFHDEDADVRANAVWALGRIGRAQPGLVIEHIPAIMLAAGDPDPRVRSNFLWASEYFAAENPQLLQHYLHVYTRLLEDPDTRTVRREAPEIFRIIAKQRADLLPGVVPLLEALLTDRDEIVRLNARGALNAIRKGLPD